MINWNGVEPPPPRGPEEKPVHLTIRTIGERTEVDFKDDDGTLATMRGPRALEALAWILAGITDPFPTVFTSENN